MANIFLKLRLDVIVLSIIALLHAEVARTGTTEEISCQEIARECSALKERVLILEQRINRLLSLGRSKEKSRRSVDSKCYEKHRRIFYIP